jgi:hypothetical protein
MIAESIPEIEKLNTGEKLQLASELWDENIDKISSDEAESVLKERRQARLKEYQNHPKLTVTLEHLRRKAGLDS